MKGYNISTDYEKLWGLMKSGYVVPGWVFRGYLKKQYWDIVQIKKGSTPDTEWTIGYRGFGYGWEHGKEEFLHACKASKLKYVMPIESTKSLRQ